MIKVENLKKSFKDKAVFSNVSFVLNKGEKIGIIGKNGSGKTTLLKVIISEIESDDGQIRIDKNERIGYLPQALETDLKKTVKDFFSENQKIEDWQIRKSLGKLGVHNLNLNRKLKSFSGGELTRTALARLLIKEPTILLLDEPTNHLDIEGIIYLQKFLFQFGGGVLLISHDRWILDKVPEKIIDLQSTERGRVAKVYHGNFSDYKEAREREIKKQKTLYQLQQKKINKLREDIEKKKEKAKRMDRNMLAELRKDGRPFGSPGVRLARSAKAEEAKLKKFLESKEQIEKPKKEKPLRFLFDNYLAERQRIIQAKNLSFGFKGKLLFDAVSLELYGKERVALMGPNGSGKTIFIKILLGEIKSKKSEIKWNPSAKIGYLPQEIIFNDYSKTALEEFGKDLEIPEDKARRILGRFLFSGDEQIKKLKDLSLGERRRLYLAKIVAFNPNILLLDEPTNHLDIYSIEAIEKALSEFEGAILIISHDRCFLRNIGVEKFYFLKEGSLKELFSLEDIEKVIK